MSVTKPFLSVVIPVFNEVTRIKNLEEITKYFKKYDAEIIITNDGSTDLTFKHMRLLQKGLEFKIISYPKNMGKGYAVKTGVLQSTGKHILVMDIDLSTPLLEFKKFLPHINNHHVVIATRKHKNAKVLKHQNFLRESLGKGFTYTSNFILGLNLSDFTCGFKFFQKEAAQEIFRKVTINRWGYDCELLFIAQRSGLKIKEVPIVWINDDRSKVKFPEDILHSFTDLLRVRLNYIRGLYN